ncbi:MAG: response regulator [Pseudanabaenaceae cyanobacterium bins.39]|nr:response regulator [Pseudanabaenaceae cyanobacterium bins.39]
MIQQSNVIPIGKVVSQLTYSSLMSKLKLLVNQTGCVTVVTAHFSWEIFIYGGSVAFVEDHGYFWNTLRRKFKTKKVYIRPEIWHGFNLRAMHGIDTCKLLGSMYEFDRDSCLPIFKEVMLENLLAIALEKNLSLVWQPVDLDLKIILPIWQLIDLEQAISKVVDQWQVFKHIRHPYQTIQLIDADCSIAQIPLFIKLTNGKYRVNEIADYFQQHISRTALNFDKLAENRIVAVLPLPKRSAQFNERETSEDATVIKSLPKIMIIDDSPVLLKQFGDLISSWGYQLSLVNDSAQATQKMLADKPNLVFMDINMPTINGFELIKQIRRQPSLADIPLILVTSENSITNNFRAKWANCRFIGKPQNTGDIKEFKEQVRAILQEFTPL